MSYKPTENAKDLRDAFHAVQKNRSHYRSLCDRALDELGECVGERVDPDTIGPDSGRKVDKILNSGALGAFANHAQEFAQAAMRIMQQDVQRTQRHQQHFMDTVFSDLSSDARFASTLSMGLDAISGQLESRGIVSERLQEERAQLAAAAKDLKASARALGKLRSTPPSSSL